MKLARLMKLYMIYLNCHDHDGGRVTERQARVLKLIERLK